MAQAVAYKGRRNRFVVEKPALLQQIETGVDARRVEALLAESPPELLMGAGPVREQIEGGVAHADVRVGVYDGLGRLVFDWQFQSSGAQGRYGLNEPVIWSGADRNGHAVPTGLYFLRIEATNNDGSVSQRTLRVLQRRLRAQCARQAPP